MKNLDGSIPVMIAAQAGHQSIVIFLVQTGANLNETNNKFQSPMEIAKNFNRYDILQYLIEERQKITENYLDSILAKCYREYRGDYSSRNHDCDLLNYYVSLLTGENITSLREQDKYKHFAHNLSLPGVVGKGAKVVKNPDNTHTVKNGQTLEGWHSEHYLPLRIRYLFEIIVQVIKGELKAKKLPGDKNQVLRKLKNEILVELETLRARKDALIIQQSANNIKEQLIQAHCLNMIAKIAVLDDDQEYSYNSGFIGHSVYVSFLRKDKFILIRVDNLGGGCNKHKLITKDNKNGIPSQYGLPKLIGKLPISDFQEQSQQLLTYLRNLFLAKFEAKEPALLKIYSEAFINSLQGFDAENIWQPQKIQSHGNCVVRSHHVGQQIRLRIDDGNRGKALYSWVREKEIKMSVGKSTDTAEKSSSQEQLLSPLSVLKI